MVEATSFPEAADSATAVTITGLAGGALNEVGATSDANFGSGFAGGLPIALRGAGNGIDEAEATLVWTGAATGTADFIDLGISSSTTASWSCTSGRTTVSESRSAKDVVGLSILISGNVGGVTGVSGSSVGGGDTAGCGLELLTDLDDSKSHLTQRKQKIRRHTARS